MSGLCGSLWYLTLYRRLELIVGLHLIAIASVLVLTATGHLGLDYLHLVWASNSRA